MQLPSTGRGFSWVPQDSWELIVKSLKPTFVFVDCDEFVSSNVNHRLNKRGIDAYVAVTAPLGVVARRYGWAEAFKMTELPDRRGAFNDALPLVLDAVDQALLAGADAIVVCDDLCGTKGPLINPLFVMGDLMDLYARIAEKVVASGVPAIFHSDGDIREYYPALAAAGFAGVHVSHPYAETVELMMRAAHEQNLAALGGIVTAHMLSRPVEELVQQAKALQELVGTVLICDDGGLQESAEVERVIEVLRSLS